LQGVFAMETGDYEHAAGLFEELCALSEKANRPKLLKQMHENQRDAESKLGHTDRVEELERRIGEVEKLLPAAPRHDDVQPREADGPRPDRRVSKRRSRSGAAVPSAGLGGRRSSGSWPGSAGYRGRTGRVWTMTGNLRVDWLPEASVAVQVTSVLPRAKKLP